MLSAMTENYVLKKKKKKKKTGCTAYRIEPDEVKKQFNYYLQWFFKTAVVLQWKMENVTAILKRVLGV